MTDENQTTDPEQTAAEQTPAAADADARWDRLILLGLLLLTLLVFGRSLAFDWSGWDDRTYLLQNQVLRQGGFGDLFTPGAIPKEQLYIPVYYVFAKLELGLFGDNPMPWHAVNLLLHLANVLLGYALLRRLGLLAPLAGLAAAFMALHPLQVESVAWIFSGRDLLATTFALVTLHIWLRYVGGGYLARWRYLALVVLACGMLTKPGILLLPVILGLISFGWRGAGERHLSRRIIDIGPSFVLAFVVWQLNGLASHAPPGGELVWQAKALRLAYLPAIIDGWLARLLLLQPSQLLYLNSQLDPAVINGLALLPVLLLLGSAYVLWRTGQRRILAYLLAAASLLAPAAQIALAYNRSFYTGDRYIYAAMLPLAAGLLLLIWQLPALARRLGLAIAVLLLAGSLLRAWPRTSAWAGPEALWTAELAQSPANPIAHTHLGNLQMERAAAVAAEGPMLHGGGVDHRALAREHYRAAIDSDLGYAIAHFNLGAMTASPRHFRAAFLADPTQTRAGFYYARILYMNGDPAAALVVLARYLEHWPRDADARVLRAEIRLQAETIAPEQVAAIYDDLKLAVQLQPGNFMAHRELGLAYGRFGQPTLAYESLARAHQLNPQSLQTAVAYARAALLVGDGQTARDLLLMAVAAKPENADYQLDLAQAHLLLGEHADAAALLETLRPGRPHDRILLSNLLNAYRALGQQEKVAEIQALLTVDPDEN